MVGESVKIKICVNRRLEMIKMILLIDKGQECYGRIHWYRYKDNNSTVLCVKIAYFEQIDAMEKLIFEYFSDKEYIGQSNSIESIECSKLLDAHSEAYERDNQ